MRALDPHVELYIGSPIEYESERITLSRVVEVLSANNLSSLIIANINLSGRQIDLVIVTDSIALVVEAKKINRPLMGNKNGSWKFETATGEWKAIGNNYYQQTLNAKYALRDSMCKFSGESVSHPNAALVFVPSIPSGSHIPSSDFKVKIGDIHLLDSFDSFNKNNPWILSKWRAFAKNHNLTEIDNLESAWDSNLMEAGLLLNRYRQAFKELYSPQAQSLIPFPCRISEDTTSSRKVANKAATGESMSIIGPSGCGKSMLAKHIGLEHIALGGIPVIIRAKYFKREFSELLNQEAALLDATSIKALFSASKILGVPLLIILDGFNECSEFLRQRLIRCVRAVALRSGTGVVVTSQKSFPELKLLNLKEIGVPEPDMEVKKEIAKLSDEDCESLKAMGLLTAAKSGLEADIIGHIGKTIAPGLGRYALLDTFVRKRMGDLAQDSINVLVHVSAYLSKNIMFSMSVREFGRLQASNSWSSLLSDRLLALNFLDIRGDRISFGHELYFNAFAAEALIRDCQNDASRISFAISTPRCAAYKSLIVGAIDNFDLLDDVLGLIRDTETLISCLIGECGVYARQWSDRRFRTVLDQIREEVRSVNFKIDGEGPHISPDSESLRSWSRQDHAIVNALSILLGRGEYLDEIFAIVDLMDQRLQEQFELLMEQVPEKTFDHSDLFSRGLNDQNSSIAISRIIAYIGFRISSARKRDTAALSMWVQAKLGDRTISDGQIFMLLKLCRHVWNGNLLIRFLPALILERYKCAPSCLRFALLEAAQYCSNCEEEDKARLVEVIDNIDTRNIVVSMLVIDALKSLSAIEVDGYEETVRAEIEQAFGDGENSESWLLARGIYDRQFDHPYDSVYWEVLHELPDDKRKKLLSMAVRAEDDSRMFLSCKITELAEFRDPATGEYIEKWTELPPRNCVCPQDALGVFVISHIVLGRLKYPLPPKVYGDSDEDDAMLACGDIYYWLNRDDVSWNKRTNFCAKAWEILSRHKLGFALCAIKECEETLSNELLHPVGTEAVNVSIVRMFPQEVSEISRQALVGNVLQHARNDWRKEEDILVFAISVLGTIGRVADLLILRSMVDHPYLGGTAIRAVKELEERL